MTDIDNVATIVETAQTAALPAKVEPGSIYVVTTSHGPEVVDLTGDGYRTTPRRKRGHVEVEDAPSFLAYYAKHADEGSEVYADQGNRRVVAVLDAHTADTARWGGHRVVLQLRHTAQWQAWARIDGKMLTQQAFAEFLEDNAPDIAEPSAAEMLEVAQSIQGTVKADFEAGSRLDNGSRRFRYAETTTASAGERGELEIPARITLHVAVFEGAEHADEVTARLRYRIAGGHLELGIKLDRPEEVVRGAFDEVVEQVTAGVPVPVLRGATP